MRRCWREGHKSSAGQGQSRHGEPLPGHRLPSQGSGPYTVTKLTPTPGNGHRFLNTDAAELLRFRVGWRACF